jgi:ADP-heptose:LPS heptosyltransferase
MAPTAKRGVVLRRFERRAKDWLILRLVVWMKPRQLPTRPDWSSGPHRVLVLRYDRLGDMILSTGIIKAIARAQPTVAIDVLASVQNSQVLEGNPNVGCVLTVQRRRPLSWIAVIRRMRRSRYDAVIDVMVMAPSLTTMLVMWLSGARHRIGLGDRGNESIFTLPVKRVQGAVHYIDHSAALLGAFGVDPQAQRPREGPRPQGLPCCLHGPQVQVSGAGGWGIWRPEIFLTATETGGAATQWRRAASPPGGTGPACRLVVNVSAGGAWRYWPAESFVAVLKALKAQFPRLECLVIGAPHDGARMEAIGRGGGAAVAHTRHAREMMAIVAASDVVFTADTAVTHVASAFGKPILTMFARGKAELWGPYDIPGGVVATHAASLDALDVPSVLASLVGVLEIAAAGQRVPAAAPTTAGATQIC